MRCWAIAGIVGAVDLVLAASWGFAIEPRSWLPALLVIAGLESLAAYYARVRSPDDSRIQDTLRETSFLIGFTAVAATLSYLLASMNNAFVDSQLIGLDTALGFNWLEWHKTVAASPRASAVLSLLYMSSMAQIVLVIVALGLTGRSDRTREFNALFVYTLLAVLIIAALFPAQCGWVYFNEGLDKAYHLEHLTALRDGSMRVLDIGQFVGLVTFPSFHTVLAILVPWVCRGVPLLFWPVLVTNAGVMISIPSEGGHYLVDIIAGCLIAVLAIGLRRRAAGRRAARPPRSAGPNLGQSSPAVQSPSVH